MGLVVSAVSAPENCACAKLREGKPEKENKGFGTCVFIFIAILNCAAKISWNDIYV